MGKLCLRCSNPESSHSLKLDLKATALLKLIYLEMFGHDMSWASFHVLEVMSSPKFHQKRVGYLGAVQSFRPDTEVLMLATNLLKKVTGMSQLLPKADIDWIFRMLTHHSRLQCLYPLLHYLTSLRLH